jgi:hypothetical protein
MLFFHRKSIIDSLCKLIIPCGKFFKVVGNNRSMGASGKEGINKGIIENGAFSLLQKHAMGWTLGPPCLILLL